MTLIRLCVPGKNLTNVLQSAIRRKCSVVNEELNVHIQGESLRFPLVWLRDNCQCEHCFHPSAKSRNLDWSKFNIDVKAKDLSETSNSLQVTWDDDHKSTFKLDWLKLRGFTAAQQKQYTETIYKPEKVIWHGKQFNEICSKHDYTQILESDEALYQWLLKLSVYGVALIENTTHSETALDALIERIGFIKRTHYGIKFVVQHVENTNNVAYLSNNLQMHTDLPYYEYSAGVNILHCVVQTESAGGENVLTDCHFVANYIKENHPEAYKLLTEVNLEWSDFGSEHGNQFYKLNRGPVVCLDKEGRVSKINFSVPQRGSHFPAPIETVKPWYEAYTLFYTLLDKFAARFKNKAGNILVFDNVRLSHGRNAYEDKAGNVRKLIGAYVDWDEIYSRLRCLKIKLHNEDGIL